MTPNEPLETLTIAQTVVAFHTALHAMGAAKKEWERRPSEGSAARLESAAEAVETALGMMVVVVPAGLGQEMAAVDEWRRERAGMMPRVAVDIGVAPRRVADEES